MSEIKKIKPSGIFTNYIFKSIPLAFDESMSYYETLCGVLDLLKNTVDVVNNNAELLAELDTYVKTYFDNLDVQEEINNKLDEMVEAGTLQEIISEYLNSKAIFGFDTVADLKQATNLINGSYAETLGYYEINDGGSSIYKIRTITNDDIVNEGDIIALSNNTLIAELVIKDKKVNVKQFGAVGDGTTDDTEKIQMALNYFKVNTDTLNQNAGEFYSSHSNAFGIVEFQKAKYLINSTLTIQNYINVELNGAEIIASETSSFDNDFMFSINSPNATAWTLAYPQNKSFIQNGTITGNNTGVKGLYMCDGRLIKNITFQKLTQSIFYPYNVNGISHYIDNIKIENCLIQDPIDNNLYQINKEAMGEATRLIGNHFPTSSSQTEPIKAIKLLRSLNSQIDTNLNGTIELYKSSTIINNWHCERGQLIAVDSETTLNNCIIYKRDVNIIPIVSQDSNYQYTLNQNSKPIILNSTNIINYYTNSDFNFDNIDIDVSKSSQILQINNSYRETWNEGIAEKSITGLCIKTQNKIYNNIFDNCYIEENYIYSQEKVSNSSNFSSSVMGGLNVSNSYIAWKLASGTYYYKVIVLADVDRLLGSNNCPEQHIAVTTNGVKINIDTAKISHNVIRIYRGTSSGNYTQYVDIPNPKNYHVFDNGLSCNGYKWQNTTNSTIPTIQSCRGGYYEVNIHENTINFFAKVIDLTPNTAGSFKVNDELKRVNATTGTAKNSYCVASGTPGTWVQGANLQ